MIIDCKSIAQDIKNKIKNIIAEADYAPVLYIYQVGDNPASNAYIRGKLRDCEEIGIEAELVKLPENITEENLVISALFHDLCKVNYYDPKVKWFKDESNNWHSYQSYEINDRLPLGHGEKSVILLQQFIRLTGEEIASIRWHMAFSDSGTWISIYEKPAMMKSLEICPLVMVIAMADQFATFLMEKREDPKVCCLIS